MVAPITALYTGLLALLILALAVRVVLVRREASIGLGHGDNEDLQRRIRIHGNATEYIPIALLLILVLELNGSSSALLHTLGASLTVGRLAHAQGITSSSGNSPGRLIDDCRALLSDRCGHRIHPDPQSAPQGQLTGQRWFRCRTCVIRSHTTSRRCHPTVAPDPGETVGNSDHERGLSGRQTSTRLHDRT